MGNFMESNTYVRPVRPVSPVVSYIGGKRKLTPSILPWIEAVPHVCYAEPFIGMGGVFLQRRYAPKVEIINDRSREVATFFRVLQRHYVHFLDVMKWQITIRDEFDRLCRVDPDTLTDLERAARFLYLQACSYGGKPAGRTFGLNQTQFYGFNLTRLEPLLEAVYSRLQGVVIENLPFDDLIRRYDGPETLFYLDPPYWDCEGFYGKGLFERADFARLAEILAGIQGRFILSINDTPGVRETFAAFFVEEVQTQYTVARGKVADVTELLFIGPPERAWDKVRAQGELL